MPGELGATSRTTITRLDFGRRETRGPVLSSVRSPGRRQNTGFRRSGRLRHRLRLPEGEQHGTLRPFQRAPPKTVETELTRRLGPVNLPPRRRSVESFRTCSHHLQKQSEWVRSRYRRTGYRDGSARITRDSEIGRDRAAHGNFARIADHWGTYISFHPVASPWMHFRLEIGRAHV